MQTGLDGRGQGSEEEGAQAVWRALSNPVRRSILDLLRDGPRTTGELADRFPDLSRFAVMQHLKVLEEGELVIPRREGRVRYNYLNPVPIQGVYDRWVVRYIQPWTQALVSLKSELEGGSGSATTGAPGAAGASPDAAKTA